MAMSTSPRRVATVQDDSSVDDKNNIAPRSPSQHKQVIEAPAPSSPINFDFSTVVKPQDLLEMVACPCCKQCIDERKQQTLMTVSGRSIVSGTQRAPKSGTDSDTLDSDDDDMLPKGVADGLNYQPRRILAEGWLHKKGTGQDWMGSRSWKPRWVRLITASLEGFEVDVPLLMIYWYPGTANPSNVIILDATVAVPIDIDDNEKWDSFRFEIRNAKTVSTNLAVYRTFCTTKKARDAWIYAISQALLVYEKANDKARKAAIQANKEARRVGPQQISCCPKSPPFDDVWSGERFISTNQNSSPLKKGMSTPSRMGSPPTSPTSRNARNRSTTSKLAVVPRCNSSPQLPRPPIDKC